MKITFTGGMPGGTLKDPHTGALYDFTRGEPIDVPDEFAKLALENTDWKPATKKESKAQ